MEPRRVPAQCSYQDTLAWETLAAVGSKLSSKGGGNRGGLGGVGVSAGRRTSNQRRSRPPSDRSRSEAGKKRWRSRGGRGGFTGGARMSKI